MPLQIFFDKQNPSLPPLGEREGGYYLLGTITHLKTGSTITEFSFDAWGRRRDKDDWSYTLTSEPALFADRGFTSHEFLADFSLYNMNGRLYDPVVGRFLSPDPFVQNPSFSQSYNRYSYCLNNPLKFTDYSGEKWKWNYLNPFYHFQNFMQWVNDKTPQLRQNMVKMGVPDFGAGVSVNGNGNVNFNGSYKGQEVFNTNNINRGNPDVVFNELAEVRRDYGQAWMAATYGEIRPYQPSTWDSWYDRSQTNIVSKITYEMVDGIWVTAQSLAIGPNARHINGTQVSGYDRTDAFANTVMWSMTASSVSKYINSNNWLRIGDGLNKGQEVFRIAWGAHPRYLKEIRNPYLRELNQWLRRQGGGHFDIWKY